MHFNRILTATLTFAILFAFVIFFLLTLPSSKYVPIIAVASGLITLYMGLIKYWVDTDSIFKSLFESFNLRFDNLNENLNRIIEGKDTKRKIKTEVIQDYLNLCAEEYFWYRKGRIPKTVWNSWLQGIDYYVENDDIKALFTDQLNQKDSYYGFLDTLKLRGVLDSKQLD